MRYVLDAPALINNPGFRFPTGEKPFLTTDEVLREWKDFRTRMTAEHAVKTGQLQIKVPRSSSRDMVRQKARELGVAGLSAADESVLALAHDENGWERTTLITDDYRVQNVAVALKIAIEGAMMDEIKGVRKYSPLGKPAAFSSGPRSVHETGQRPPQWSNDSDSPSTASAGPSSPSVRRLRQPKGDDVADI